MRFLRKLVAVSTIFIGIQAQGQEFPTPEANLPDLRTQCDAKDQLVFSLVPLEVSIDLQKLDWSPIWKDFRPTYIQPDRHNNISIVICDQGNAAYRIQSIRHHILFQDPESDFQFNVRKDYRESYWQYRGQGLYDALFGEPESLRLFTDGGDAMVGDAIKIKGWHIDDQRFVSVSWLHKDADQKFYNHVPAILIGKLVLGDPFSGSTVLNCDSRSLGFIDPIVIGTATLELSGCGYPGAGHSMIKILSQVRITDNNPAIPEDQRGTEIIIKGEELAGLATYSSSHHNWCDSFFVKVPQWNATYVLTKRVVEGFPRVEEREFVGTAIQYGDQWNILQEKEKGSSLCY